MSITEALGRITTIQSAIAQVTGAHQATAAAAPTGGASGTTAAAAYSAAAAGASGTDFEKVLSGLAPGPAGTGGAPATGTATGAPDGSTDGNDVVSAARKYLGVPYVWGGTDPARGLDCSGLVQRVFKDLGVDVPRVARDQAKAGTEVPSLSRAEPGDLIVTRGGAHIGIYIGDNKMLHAPRPGEDVQIRELFETDRDILTIRRIVPSPSENTPEATRDASAAGVATGAAADAAALAGQLAMQRAAFAGSMA